MKNSRGNWKREPFLQDIFNLSRNRRCYLLNTWIHKWGKHGYIFFFWGNHGWNQFWVSGSTGSIILFYFTTLDQVWYISQKGSVILGTASIIHNPVYNSGGLPHACLLLLVHEYYLSSSGKQLHRWETQITHLSQILCVDLHSRVWDVSGWGKTYLVTC